jgi:hypothetical protein
MRPGAAAVAFVQLLLPLLSLACVSSEVRLTTRRQPSRSSGCEVAILETGKPAFTYDDLATDRVSCVVSRAHCISRLREDACEIGADTVYGLGEMKQTMETTIEATLARRTGGPAPPPGAVGHVETFSR